MIIQDIRIRYTWKKCLEENLRLLKHVLGNKWSQAKINALRSQLIKLKKKKVTLHLFQESKMKILKVYQLKLNSKLIKLSKSKDGV